MPSNLRSVFAQVNRGSGKVFKIAAGEMNKIGFLRWTACGFAGFYAWELWSLIDFCFTGLRNIEELELRKQRHEELVAKAMQELRVKSEEK